MTASTKLQTGLLVLVCQASGAEIDTHTTYTRADLHGAHWAKVMAYCPGCRRQHVFKFAEARLRPQLEDGYADGEKRVTAPRRR